MSDQDELFSHPEDHQPHPYRTVLIVVILVLFTVTILAQFKSTFKSYDKRVIGAPVLTADEQQKNQIDALKKTDTDGDGLSDYDELYIYHTSPYLKDTDGDGIPDGEEIKRGTDPLCAEGKQCGINLTADTGSASSTAPASAPAPAADTTVQALAPQVTGPAPTASSLSQFTTAQIRDALVANGVPKDKIDALSDAQLLQLMQEAQTGAATSTATPQ